MVDDFGNLNFVGPIDGLGELVVVDQHQAGPYRLQDVGLRKHADEAGVLIDDMVD